LLNPALPSPSKQLTVTQINALLKAHNDMRRNVQPAASTMPMLTWDQTLAEYALRYISTCPGVKHSSQTARVNPNAYHYGYLGENLAAGTDTSKYGINGGAAAVAMWNSQAKGYTYVGRPTCQITNPHVCGTCNITDCGHYTQVVWGSSKTVGCAYAYCPNTVYKNFWLCAYGPGGNYMGQVPYAASTPKDTCQLQGTTEQEFHTQRRDGNLTAREHAESLQQFVTVARSQVKGANTEAAPLPIWISAGAAFVGVAVLALLVVALRQLSSKTPVVAKNQPYATVATAASEPADILVTCSVDAQGAQPPVDIRSE
jgi:hypothetical protein